MNKTEVDRGPRGEFIPASGLGSAKVLERPGVAWGVLGLCLLVTFFSWQVSLSQLHHRGRERFQRHVEQVTEAIQTRMQAYEQVLKGTEGLFAASERVKRTEWHDYIQSLDINQRFPGIRALGFVARVPHENLDRFVADNRKDGLPDYKVRTGWPLAEGAGTNPVHYLVQYVEPSRGNARALGYDMATEPHRRDAAEYARDTGDAALSGKIRLVQSEDDLPAVVLLLPVYRNGMSVTNVEQRRLAIEGWVYGAFVLRDLMAGLFESRSSEIDFEIFDGSRASHASLLYDADGVLHAFAPDAAMFQTFAPPVTMAGRQWTMHFSTRPAFDAATSRSESTLLLLAGIAISFLLFAITRSLAFTRQRALGLARQMTEKFRIQERAVIASNNGIFITDAAEPGNPILYANPAMERITGCTAEEMFARTIFSIIRQESGQDSKFQTQSSKLNTQDSLEAAMAAGEECRAVLPGLRKDGSEFWMEISVSPIRDEAGIVNHFVGIATDITDRRDAEARLQEAAVAVTAASRAKGEFLANMSHEIRTPMNAVIGMTELALGTELTREQRSYLSSVRNSARDLLTMIDDVLDFSRIEAGKFELHEEPFKLRESLGVAFKVFGVRAAEKGLEITLRFEPDVPDAFVGDVRRLRQIFNNLVGNAIKFTGAGEVSVTVSKAASAPKPGWCALRVCVADTGIGVPPDQQRAIFEAFTQADASVTREYGGTGLGLAISANLCRLMGGEIQVQSDGVSGSRFHFTVTIKVDAGGAARVASDGMAKLAGQRVLVVDDHLANRGLVAEMLARWGMLPVVTSNAAEALGLIGSRAPGFFSMALVDARMPERDGFALAKELDAISRGGLRVIMMLSSPGNPDEIRRCREMHHETYLAKPIIESELLDVLIQSGVPRSAGLGATPMPVAAQPVTKSKLRVLLAEDNSVNRELATTVLERMGHSVVSVWNGVEAVELWKNGAVDVVLMDIQMPLMDGMEATAAIRRAEQGTGRQVPIIGLSAHAMKTDRDSALALGMDDYLTKPLQAEDLERVMERLNTRSDKASPATANSFDAPALAKSFGGDAVALSRLIDLYLETTPPLVERMVQSLQRADAPSLAYAAHTLQGSLSQMGNASARDLAAEVETLARVGKLSEAGQMVGSLEKRLTEFEASVRNWRAGAGLTK